MRLFRGWLEATLAVLLTALSWSAFSFVSSVNDSAINEKQALTSKTSFSPKAMSTTVMSNESNLPSVRFLDEYVIDKNLTFKQTSVGGLSSIDYHNGFVYMISDHGNNDADSVLGAPRLYKARIELENKQISNVQLVDVKPLLPKGTSAAGIDPESLRIIADSQRYIWSSEGDIKKGFEPGVYVGDLNQRPEAQENKQNDNSALILPKQFELTDTTGPYHNSVFEGLSLSMDEKGFWLAMEGPLKQDGEEPSSSDGAWVRLSYVDFKSKQITQQYAFNVDPIPHEPLASKNAFRTTGIVEVMQYDASLFIIIERAYTSGLSDGGNRVKLYMLDISNASDVKSVSSLKNQRFIPATKQLLLDMTTIKTQLPSGHIDNIEGITFGPQLKSGNRSLLLVSDNNFNAYGEQLSQILLFEIVD